MVKTFIFLVFESVGNYKSIYINRRSRDDVAGPCEQMNQ